jgi:serine/threonine protein kinase
VTWPLDDIVLGKVPLSDKEISWGLRKRIAYDISCGMTYLHSRIPPIVHRDLRSPNIFLCSHDEKAPVVAKV